MRLNQIPEPPISDTRVLKEYSGYSRYTFILVSLASIINEHNLTSSPSPVADFCAAFSSSVTLRFLKSFFCSEIDLLALSGRKSHFLEDSFDFIISINTWFNAL